LEVDVRVVAATHQNLEESISNQRFRQDLFFRLNVVPLLVPPLRERKAEIAELAVHFGEMYCQENQVPMYPCRPLKKQPF